MCSRLIQSGAFVLPVLVLAGCGKPADTVPKAAADAAKASAAADAAKAAEAAKVKEAVDDRDRRVRLRLLADHDRSHARADVATSPRSKSCAAPMNQFVNVKRYPPADYRGVSAPNADTLYSLAWLDLAEPQVFSHPDMGKRFYLFPMVDLWMTIFAVAGQPHRRRQGRELPASPGRAGRATCRQGMKHIPVADALHGDPRPHLRRRHGRRTTRPSTRCRRSTRSRRSRPGASRTRPRRRRWIRIPGFSMTDKPQAVILAMGTARLLQHDGAS